MRRRHALRIWLTASLTLFAASAPAAECDDWQAVVVSVEGTVEIRHREDPVWRAAKPEQPVCRGDALRVGGFSRAAVQLPDETVLRLDQHTSLTFAAPPDRRGSLIELLRGVIHVISRDPRALGFNTPYANAGLEGTEFVLAVKDGETEVTVIEGEVVFDNAAGRTQVRDGERGTAPADRAPERSEVADPLATAQWAAHVLPILSRETVSADSVPDAGQTADTQYWLARAASRLAVGRVAEAEADIALASMRDPANPDIDALRAVIALSMRQREAALALARRAEESERVSAAAALALSFAEQAHFRLDAAISAAEKAVALAPESPLAWTRLAELRLAGSDVAGATTAVAQALTMAPDLGYAHSIHGFAELMRQRPSVAAEAFRQAIRLDQASPLPRLGLGLALSRQRQIREARAQMELAVLFDPGNSLARSYVARSYHDEFRSELTEVQLDLARQLDPLDPTPWLYDALRKQSENRPIEALNDLNYATRLSDSGAPVRSTLRIDDDLGVRSGGIGRLHRDLGFEQLALVAGWKAVMTDPAEYSAHRLLADVYSALPRHEVARVHELWQSQLLQPINVTPIPPQLAEANLFIVDNAGPVDLAFSEPVQLTGGTGISLQGSAVAAGHGTRGENVMVSGRHDTIAYSLGYFGFSTDGFRANNDLDQSIVNAFVQIRPGPRSSIVTELRATDTRKGDLRQLFDPNRYNPLLRHRERFESARIGLRHDIGPDGLLLASVIHDSSAGLISSGPAFSLDAQYQGMTVDLQHQWRRDRWRLISGASHRRTEIDELSTLRIDLPIPPFTADMTEDFSANVTNTSAYAYLHLDTSPRLTTTLGASYDRVVTRFVDRGSLNPKLGVSWQAGASTTVRAAVFRTLQGWVVSRHDIVPRLEPTHVAGFNQRFFGSEGEQAWRYGAAVDHRFGDRINAGIELSRRDLSVPTRVIRPPSALPELRLLDVSEELARGYLYWTPSDRLALHSHYQYERVDGGGDVTADGHARLRTHRLPVGVNWFHPGGLRAGLDLTWIEQRGLFAASPFLPGDPLTADADRFWIASAMLGYRLPRRRGLVSLNVHNLLDRQFRFQDTDPDNPRMIPERMISLRFTVKH